MFIRGFCNYVLWQYLGILKTNYNVLWQYLEILKTNHNVLWQYLEILKINQRFKTVFGITYHFNIKQFEIRFRT